MKPIVDISDKFTVDNTSFDEVKKSEYSPPSHQIAIVREISVVGDSNFLDDGRIRVELQDEPITQSSQNSANEVPLFQGFSVEFSKSPFDLFILRPGQKVKTQLRTTNATGTAQVLYRVTELSPQEFEVLQRRMEGL